MVHRFLICCALLLACALPPAHAADEGEDVDQQAPSEFVMWGWSYRTFVMGKLPHLAYESKHHIVGYNARVFKVLNMDMWTEGGVYCECDGSGVCRIISTTTAAQLLNVEPQNLQQPLFYSLPYGWLAVAGFFLFLKLFTIWLANKRRERIIAMLEDPRNRKGLAMYMREKSGSMNAAVQYMVSEGVPMPEAVARLRYLQTIPVSFIYQVMGEFKGT